MKKLLFGAAIAMIVISPALAVTDDEDGCPWCPSWRSPMSDHAPPWWPTPQGYGQDYGRRPTGQPSVDYQQAGKGLAARARVTHVPRLGRRHQLNESR
jgi:hypothetical protein